MNRHQYRWALCLAMLFFAVGAWAADRTAPSANAPAILTALGQDNATLLDDQAAMSVRGQEYKYVLVKILGINALDGGQGVQWTWNPLGFRYGAWGGPGWTDGGTPADLMDGFFMAHDLAYGDPNVDKLAADKLLIAQLYSLATTPNGFWGLIYDPDTLPAGLTSPLVQVSGLSFIGNKFFFGWRAMPYTEYARREALAGLGILVFGRSLGLKLQ